MGNNKRIDFMHVPIDNLTAQEMMAEIEGMIAARETGHIVGLNMDQALRTAEDEKFREIYCRARLVFTDGKPIMSLARRLERPIVQRLPGPDFMLALCGMASEKGYRIFLMGAGPGVARRAADRLVARYPSLIIAGTYSPPLGFEKDAEEIGKINAMLRDSRADMLFVGISSPKQDYFIYENMRHYQVPVSFSMGAAIDFISGNIKRAPKWMRRLGLEWFYRFLQEPRRMFRRYFINDMRVFRYFRKYREEEKKAGRI